MTVISAGQSAMKSGPTVSILGGTVVFDDDLQLVKPGSGTIGKIARYGDIPLGYYNDPVKTAEVFMEVDGVRYVMPGDFATVEHDGSVTLLGRGSVVINSGGRRSSPKRSSPRCARIPTCSTPSSSGHPTSGGGRRWPPSSPRARAAPPPRVHPGPLPLEHRRLQAAASPLHRRDIQRSPSGKPDYRWADGIVLGGDAAPDAG